MQVLPEVQQVLAGSLLTPESGGFRSPEIELEAHQALATVEVCRTQMPPPRSTRARPQVLVGSDGQRIRS